MSQITIKDCTINIKQNIQEGGHGNYYDYGKTEDSFLLPSVLATPEAMTYWRKAQKAGWIDENYQLKVSKAHAALLADFIGRKLNLVDRWKPFGELWNTSTLRKDYDQAFSSVKGGTIIDLIKKTLSAEEA